MVEKPGIVLKVERKKKATATAPTKNQSVLCILGGGDLGFVVVPADQQADRESRDDYEDEFQCHGQRIALFHFPV
jgi:hypothetical protein